jgi:SAM-dependent methyltransferase
LTPVVYTGQSERWHEDYERGRPGWPREVVEIPEVPSSGTALELGAGTGKLTRLLVGRFDHVIAAEPDEGMRRLLVENCPDVEIVAGGAEAISLADASVDAVFAAECFHLFDAERALAEIARVLRPRGVLVLMWNLPSGPTDPSIAAVEEILRRRAPDDLPYDPVDLNSRRYASGELLAPFANSPFEELKNARLLNPQTIDRDGVVAFLASMGWISDLRDEERLPLLEEVRSMLPAPTYGRNWETHLHWARLAGNALA